MEKNKKSSEDIFFQKRILKTNYPNLAISMKDLRTYAKQLVREGICYSIPEEPFYEDVLLSGIILAYEKKPFSEKVDRIFDYLSLVDNWSLIDSFCNSFTIKKVEEDEVFFLLINFLNDPNPFANRFALIMFLSHYIKLNEEGKKLHRPKHIELPFEEDPKGKYIDLILELIDKEYFDYYASMGAAWVIAEAFLFYPNKIIDFLQTTSFDNETHLRTINKIIQSKNPSKEVKVKIRGLKRK